MQFDWLTERRPEGAGWRSGQAGFHAEACSDQVWHISEACAMLPEQACLHPDPEQRLSCEDLLRLPYLANVEALFPDAFWHARVRTPGPVSSLADDMQLAMPSLL